MLSDDTRGRREELWQTLANLLPAIRLLWLRTWAGFSDAMPRHGSAIVSARQKLEVLIVNIETQLLDIRPNIPLVSGAGSSFRTIRARNKKEQGKIDAMRKEGKTELDIALYQQERHKKLPLE